MCHLIRTAGSVIRNRVDRGYPERVNFADVLAARSLLEGVATVTPTRHSRWLSELTGSPVHLKCENLQRTGSFKSRGAYVRIARLTYAERTRGVVAASAGNHAQGVALAARELGAKATIFMPQGAALPKVDATRGYGADVRFSGLHVGDALAAAQEFAAETGATFIHPFDHEDIIAGQGTVGLEILEQVPDVETILVPVGGGGLLSGIALLREVRPDVKVVGVQSEAAAGYPASLERGRPVEVALGATMADGIAVGKPGALAYDLVATWADDVITVSEEALSESLMLLLERAKLLVEPAGVAGVAALLAEPDRFSGTIVSVLSGGNIDSLVLLQVVRHGLAAAGRFLMFRLHIADRPGELMRLLTHLAEQRVNVLNISHDRGSEELGVGEVEVRIQVATRGVEHRENVKRALVDLGYTLS